MLRNSLLMVGLFAFVGCGGDSGVSDSKKLSELTMEESKDECLAQLEDYPEKTVDCGNGLTLKVGISAADCDGSIPPATCTATVADSRDCVEQMYNKSNTELCSDQALPASCQKLLQCGG